MMMLVLGSHVLVCWCWLVGVGVAGLNQVAKRRRLYPAPCGTSTGRHWHGMGQKIGVDVFISIKPLKIHNCCVFIS